MRLTKTKLRALIRECISEMHSEINEAQKSFEVHYKAKNGKDKKIKVKASSKEDAMQAARQRLAGKFFDIHFAKELSEITTTADVQGFDAPLGMKLTDLNDEEDDEY